MLGGYLAEAGVAISRRVPDAIVVPFGRHGYALVLLDQFRGSEVANVTLSPGDVRRPSRYDVATTEASTRSARRRCSRNAGKYDPCRSLGMASSIVPARVSQSRRR